MMKFIRKTLVIGALFVTLPSFANVIWTTDELDTKIVNRTGTACRIENMAIHHGLLANTPASMLAVNESTTIQLIEFYQGNSVDVDLLCGDKRISLRSSQRQGILLPGSVTAEILSADNGIYASNTQETFYGLFGGTSNLTWTVVNN